MITRVMIEIDIERDSYQDNDELESLVIDELTELMRSDIMAGARIDTIPTVTGARIDIVPNDYCDNCGKLNYIKGESDPHTGQYCQACRVNNKLSNHCKNCGNENWARITADPSGITYCNKCDPNAND